jgi:uncharacterized protein (DUF433 family)
MNITKLIATATTAAVLATAGVSIAGATSSSDSSKPSTPASAPATNQPNRAARRALVKNFAKDAFSLAAKTIGVKPADLAKALAQGQTIASVATAHNVQPQAVIDAIVQAADKKIDASQLTADQKTKVEQRVPTAAANFVNKPHPRAAKAADRAELRRSIARDGFTLAAQTIGVKPAQLLQDVRGGKTIADVANEHNVQPQTVIDAIVQAADKKIDASQLTADQKTKVEQRVPTAVAKLVNSPHPKK